LPKDQTKWEGRSDPTGQKNRRRKLAVAVHLDQKNELSTRRREESKKKEIRSKRRNKVHKIGGTTIAWLD
jgi:hypothetical protein